MGMNNRAISSIEQVGDKYIVTEVVAMNTEGLFHGGKFIAQDFEELVSFLRKHFAVPVTLERIEKEIAEDLGDHGTHERRMLRLEVE